MGGSEDREKRDFAIAKCVCGWTVTLLYVPAWTWLALSMVNQSSISLSVEDFSIADVQSTNVSSPNQTFIYFKLHVENIGGDMSVYYENLNLTFSYFRSSDIVPLGNYTIRGFHQDINEKAHPHAEVLIKQGISWQEISKNATAVVFRVDLASAVRFSEFNVKSKKRKIMAWAKVELDTATGKRISRKAVRMKHMIKHHVGGSVTFFLVFMIIATVLLPLWCFCCVECFCLCIGNR